jgi:Ca2+-binding EF-hand superfamily protein
MDLLCLFRYVFILLIIIKYTLFLGDRLSDDDVDQLFQGMEDAQGNINYEGIRRFSIYGGKYNLQLMRIQ